MTAIAPGKILKRSIRIPGVDKPVQVEITSAGLAFYVKGSRKKVMTSWFEAVQAGHTPTTVPGFLMDKPHELLRYQAAHRQSQD